MTLSVADSLDIIKGTSLRENEYVELPILATGESALAVRTSQEKSFEDWKTLRTLVTETGRWPCVTVGHSHGGPFSDTMHEADFFSRFYYETEWKKGSRSGDNPEDILQAARHLDLDQELSKIRTHRDEPLNEWIEFFREETHKEYGQAPAEDDIGKEIDSGRLTSYFELEEWFFKWELSHLGTQALDIDDRYLSHIKWYDPSPDQMAIIMFPTANCWEILAFMHWYAGESWNSQVLVAVLERWHQRYGAELVSHFGTMLHLLPQRTPKTPGEAFELALEQHLIAGCTTTLPCISVRDHARTMLKAKRWFLHERP